MPATKDPAKLDLWATCIYGCSHASAVTLNDGLTLRDKGTKALAYVHQRQAAKKRGIAWQITFSEWLDVWVMSGHWAERGVGRAKYVMARHGDEGPYAVANVSIQLATQNSRDGIKKSHATMAAEGWAKQSRIGRGRGWTYRDRGRRHYQVVVGRRYVGVYATQEEAEVAYRLALDSLSVHSEPNRPFFCVNGRVMTTHKSCAEMRDAV